MVKMSGAETCLLHFFSKLSDLLLIFAVLPVAFVTV